MTISMTVAAAGARGGGPALHLAGATHPALEAVQRIAEQGRGDGDETRVVHGAESVVLDEVFLDVLALVARGLRAGQPVTMFVGDADDRELTSQEAADILNVSRPHVVKLAGSGELPHRKVGNRHRFRLADVLDYDRRETARRDRVLAELAPAEGYSSRDF